MKKNYAFIAILVILFNIFYINPSIASNLQLGGEISASITGLYNAEQSFGIFPDANLDLELFLPSWNNNEIRCAGNFYYDITEKNINFFWKKFYWKHRFEDFHITIGKQPISWSFGSLLNPVDYTLGSIALDEEYSTKYQNALNLYFPVNWNTSLSLIASKPDNREDIKFGLRGRTLINDFDVSLIFVQEDILFLEKGSPRRFGVSTKGDIGKFGVYGSLGCYMGDNEETSFSILAGADYSYFFQAGNQLYFQTEYINIPAELLFSIAGPLISEQPEKTGRNIQLLVNNISYQIDEFSRIGLTSFFSLVDSTKILMPTYSNQIDTNTTVNLKAGLTVSTSKTAQLFLEFGFSRAF